MEGPIDKMRRAFEKAQAMAELRSFAQQSVDQAFEKEWALFIDNVVHPAFDKVKREFFKERLTELPERQADPGFKVKDFPNREFWFWIELRGKRPEYKA